jgi:hypothetical protein
MSIIVTGGKLADGTITKTTEVIGLDEPCGTRIGPSMIVARYFHAQVRMKSGDVFVCGGQNSQEQYIDSCEAWSGMTKDFQKLNDKMHHGRRHHAVVCLPNGKILVIGGSTKEGFFNDTCELFDPVTESFTLLTVKLTVPMSYVSACMLPNGEVFIFGLGEGASCFEYYSPTQNIFGGHGRIPDPLYPTACIYKGAGKVLLLGGPEKATKMTMLFDLDNRTLSEGPATNIERKFPFVCNYGNGNLFVGGWSEATGKLSIGEFYDPASNSFNTGCMFIKSRYGPAASKYQY